ncbi:ABC transporter ATP-binding protein [Ornithinibacillus sp. BX22]|uniref:ABC transporter ATP-binding protein n=1 Tax=Ornithinibacillus hominis TaxID=2763055 RepID=A0A923L2K8_9BACI|nr:ABC transporter ATP-binding protein [Ornithinibacillus hominis]MBC5635322.1 ABC transporter ATP-binding protein [Ornithinibacillus hominis]
MVLEINGVTKVFKGKGKSKLIANDNISLTMKEGEIVGLLGQNGAGKTTLVNQIVGLVTPDQGEIRLFGKSVTDDRVYARSICSVQPQSQVPLGFLTPRQAVSIIGKMRAGKNYNPKRLDMLFEALDMGKWADKEGEKLSGGARRLTAFCMAVIAPGKLVILDEPTNDVDPVRRRYLWDVIRNLTDNGTSVILVTHNVLEAEKAVDRVAIINQGKILTQGTPSEVKRSVSNQMRIELNLLEKMEERYIPEWAISYHQSGSRLIIKMNTENVTNAVAWAGEQVELGTVMDYSLTPTTIEDAYIELTSNKVVVSS